MKSCYPTTCCVSLTLIPWFLHWDMVHWDMDVNLQNGQLTFMSLHPLLVVLNVLHHRDELRNFLAKIPRTNKYFFSNGFILNSLLVNRLLSWNSVFSRANSTGILLLYHQFKVCFPFYQNISLLKKGILWNHYCQSADGWFS